MSNPTTSRFERHSRELGDLVDILGEAGIVWGRHFGLVGSPEPDAFELTFQNEALAARRIGTVDGPHDAGDAASEEIEIETERQYAKVLSQTLR